MGASAKILIKYNSGPASSTCASFLREGRHAPSCSRSFSAAAQRTVEPLLSARGAVSGGNINAAADAVARFVGTWCSS